MNDLHYLSRVCAKRDHMRIKSHDPTFYLMTDMLEI